MRIEYFWKDDCLDKRALDGGVYQVDLLSEKSDKVIHLYVGEAGCIVKRCGTHLMKFSNNANYYGLYEKDTKDDSLILRFSVAKHIARLKNGRYDPEYIESENKVKDKLKPLTQVTSKDSDNMLSKPQKIAAVQGKMKKYGFK